MKQISYQITGSRLGSPTMRYDNGRFPGRLCLPEAARADDREEEERAKRGHPVANGPAVNTMAGGANPPHLSAREMLPDPPSCTPPATNNRPQGQGSPCGSGCVCSTPCVLPHAPQPPRSRVREGPSPSTQLGPPAPQPDLGHQPRPVESTLPVAQNLSHTRPQQGLSCASPGAEQPQGFRQANPFIVFG